MQVVLSGIRETNKQRVLERLEDVALEFGLVIEEEIVLRHPPDPIAPPDDEPVEAFYGRLETVNDDAVPAPHCVGPE